MEDLIDILIPLLMLGVSVVTAVIGSKNKKKESERKAEPVEDDFPEPEVDRPAFVPLAELQPEAREAPKYYKDDPAARSIEKPEPGIILKEEKGERPKMSAEEKRKLIVYSEILKPKFDA